MRRLKLKRRQWVLAVLIAAVTAFRLVPGLGMVYTRNIYPVIGALLSHLSGFVPFAVGDIFISLSIVWVVAWPCYAIMHRKERARKALGRVGEYLLWVYVWFYAAWGLNYSQPNIYRRIGMAPAKVDKEAFRRFAYNYADSLNAAFARLGKGALRPDTTVGISKEKAEAAIQNGYWKAGQHTSELGINTPFNNCPRAKTMVFSRLSSMAGVTGSMGPFFCEFTLNADLLPHSYPATYAHEMAHLLGIANEGEANFYSYVVCTSSEDEATRFSGYYHIFFHVVNNVRGLLGEEEYGRFISRFRPEIIALARHDSHYWMSLRSSVVDEAQTFVYSLYLKGNNVEGGLRSYSSVIGIIMAWENKKSGLENHVSLVGK